MSFTPYRLTLRHLAHLLLFCLAFAGIVAPASAGSAGARPRSSGSPVAWGNNLYGQISVPENLTGIVQLATGSGHTLALRSNGAVLAWGDNSHGQTDVPGGLSGVTAIAAGAIFSLALKSNGIVEAWGDNTYGQTDVPGRPYVTPGCFTDPDGNPVGPDCLLGVVAIAAGARHGLALKSDGTVVAWGSNDDGQATVPGGLSGVTAIAAGGNFSLALKSDGTVVAWGGNDDGQATVPGGLSDVIAIAAGAGFGLALKSDGSVVAWGDGGNGQTTVPAGASGVKAIAAGANHALALKSDGTVVAWGDNDDGQSGVPAGLTGVIALSAGQNHSLAIQGKSKVIGWGYNLDGQTNIPAGLTGAVDIEAGDFFNLALKGDGAVAAWGYNAFGQTNVPAGLAGVKSIAAGTNHALVLKGDGSLAAWGDNQYGQTDLPAGLTGVKAVAAGFDHSLALKTDGAVVAWGRNQYGQTDVPAGLAGVIAIAAGGNSNLAVKDDGTVVAWGAGGDGITSVPGSVDKVAAVAVGGFLALAIRDDGTVATWGYSSAPIPAGVTQSVGIAGGDQHSLSIHPDGALVAWGDNNSGQSTVPAGLSGFTAVTAGSYHSLALLQDLAAPVTTVVGLRPASLPPSPSITPINVPYASDTWSRNSVYLYLSATDSGSSGLAGIGASATGAAPFGPTTLVSPTILSNSTEGITTLTFSARDNDGNVEEPQTFVMKIDMTAPTLSITAPVQGTNYNVGQAVQASYNCADALSGLDSANGCVGPVASGANLDTSTPGPKTFTVTAKDAAGNTLKQTVTYTVGANNAEFVSQAVPTTMAAGESYPIRITMKNTGGTTWTRAMGYVLSAQNPLTNKNWGTNLVYLPVGVSVAPGESYTFTFNATAPATAGTYNFQWRMAQAGKEWFGQFTENVPVSVLATSVNNAEFVTQTPPPANMTPGQMASVSVTMKNTGTTIWSGNGIVLTSQNPRTNKHWGTNLRYLPAGTSVLPGQSVTFTFMAKAPTAPGTYHFQWQMAKTGVEWFGQFSQNVAVTVQ